MTRPVLRALFALASAFLPGRAPFLCALDIPPGKAPIFLIWRAGTLHSGAPTSH